jgi:hydroxymethylpyrimidine pyrophosphatase-like HAD family hydrolase
MEISIKSRNRKVNNFFIGFDYDGTLAAPGYPVFPELIQKIIDLERVGVSLFFASGKNMPFIQNFVDKIGVNPRFICAENGGHIRDFTIGADSLFGNSTDLIRFNSLIQNESLPLHEPEDKVSICTKRFGRNVLAAKKIIETVISKNKLCLSVFTHPDGALDIVPQGINKTNLLDYIPHEAAIHYIGDSYNDLGMMRHTRVLPHTVANAEQDVKDAVRAKGGHIAPTPVGLGVLIILRNILESLQSEMRINNYYNNVEPSNMVMELII